MASKARLSRKLVELERNVPMEAMSIPSNFKTISEFRMAAFDQDRLFKFYDRMGFRDLKRRVKSQINFSQKSRESNKPIMSSGESDKYESILGDQPSRTKRRDKPTSTRFTDEATYKSPPKENDFEDVPF